MTEIPQHLTSYSAYEDLAKCGHLYVLKRVQQRPERPGVAGVAGSAFHTATERLDQGQRVTWLDVFSETITAREQETGINRGEWTVTGRKTQAHPDGDTIAVWMDMGQAMLDTYVAWRLRTKWRIATGLPADANGNTVGIEYRLDEEIGGHVRTAYVDRLMFDQWNNLGIVDIKSGAARHTVQLATYNALSAQAGIPTLWGCYYMARKGVHTEPRMMSDWTPDKVGGIYASGDAMLQAGIFLPRISDDCQRCWMKEHCTYYT